MSAIADEEDITAALAKAALAQLPITSGIEAILAPTMHQDESTEVDEDMVDAADLAASFDAEERAEKQVDFDAIDNEQPADTAADDSVTALWWALWQDLAKTTKPTKKKKKPAADQTGGEQLDFFTLAALAATDTAPPRPAAKLTASVHSGAATQAMLF